MKPHLITGPAARRFVDAQPDPANEPADGMTILDGADAAIEAAAVERAASAGGVDPVDALTARVRARPELALDAESLALVVALERDDGPRYAVLLKEFKAAGVPMTPFREHLKARGREINAERRHRDSERARAAALARAAQASGGVSDSGASSAPARPLTDLGNAERIADAARNRVRWVRGLDWLVWDGQRWRRDETREAQRIAVEVIRTIAAESDWHPSGANAVVQHATRSEGAPRIKAALDLLAGLPGIMVPSSDLDRDPWLLNLTNGTLDLRTATLRPHDPADMITKLAPVAWDPSAHSAQFDAFLARVQPASEMRAYIQRFVGYAATGVIREHVFPVWYGAGRNGKGTLTDACRAALGDYATDLPAEVLAVRRGDAHPTERMCLRGARFVSASETEANTELAVAFVKRMTGGDAITARLMGRDFVTFNPTHKVFLATNNRPVIHEASDGIWSRVHLVPWEVRIPDEEIDTELRDRLRDEHRAAVLRWIVDGCIAWQREGLSPPAAVLDATREYREDSEPDVLAFVRSHCTIEPDARITYKELRDAFNAWNVENGARPMSGRAFGSIVKASAKGLGIREAKTGDTRFYRGIRLRSDGESRYAPGDDRDREGLE